MGVSVAIIKPADDGCNLNCSYCYVSGNPQKINYMSIDTAKKIVLSLMSQEDVDEVEFLWHGGEPLLATRAFYEEIFLYQRKIADKNRKKYHNSFQTNMTLMDYDWIKFFSDNNIVISTSLDGPENLHNINRRKSNGEGSYKDVVDKIKLVQSYGLKVNALTVVSKTNMCYPIEIAENLKTLKINHVGFIPCFKLNGCGNIDYPSLEPGDFAEFLISLFEWYLNNDCDFEIREFEQLFSGIINRPQDICCFTGHCNRFLCFNSFGDAYACDTSPQSEVYCYGNINNKTLSEMLNSKAYRDLSEDLSTEHVSCKECDFYKYCHNGCYNMRKNGKYYFCEDRKKLYDYMLTLMREFILKYRSDFDVNNQ